MHREFPESSADGWRRWMTSNSLRNKSTNCCPYLRTQIAEMTSANLHALDGGFEDVLEFQQGDHRPADGEPARASRARGQTLALPHSFSSRSASPEKGGYRHGARRSAGQTPPMPGGAEREEKLRIKPSRPSGPADEDGAREIHRRRPQARIEPRDSASTPSSRSRQIEHGGRRGKAKDG